MRKAQSGPVLLQVGIVLGCALGCDLAGPRQGSSPAPSAAPERPDVVTNANARAVNERRCVVPRAEPSPPEAGPASRCPADPEGPPELPLGRVRFPDAPSAPAVSVERAETDAMRARGLMYRTSLDADAGMLFSWREEEERSFWMLNTCIPLDMLFIAGDGTIVGILEQVPTLNTLPRGVPCPAMYVLEVNAGWTRQHGVMPGQRIEIET